MWDICVSVVLLGTVQGRPIICLLVLCKHKNGPMWGSLICFYIKTSRHRLANHPIPKIALVPNFVIVFPAII